MATDLSEFARRFLLDEVATRRELTTPVLVWEAGASAEGTELVFQTRSGGFGSTRPRGGVPLVLPVRKGGAKLNAFAMGVTVGRAEINDVPLDDESVSRFHAWLAEGPQGWKLVDAESMNGTWMGGYKLEANKPALVRDGERLRFGNVEVVFMQPATFFGYLRTTLTLQSR